jgi:hypothetical protein
MTKPAMRMQVALTTPDGSFLQAEVVGEFDAFDTFQKAGGYRERFANAKYRAGKPCGGVVIQRADLPRVWDVPVGGRIR